MDDARFDRAKFEGETVQFLDTTFILPKSQEVACRKAKNVQAKAGNRDLEEYHFYREMEAKRKQKGLMIGDFSYKPLQNLKVENLYIIKRMVCYNLFEYVFVQKIFGYGVHPWQLMGWWGVIIFIFFIIYQNGIGKGIEGNIFDCAKISFATAIAPGYIGVVFNPGSTGPKLDSTYQVVAIAETIIGTILWAGFIGTFAKRYMR